MIGWRRRSVPPLAGSCTTDCSARYIEDPNRKAHVFTIDSMEVNNQNGPNYVGTSCRAERGVSAKDLPSGG